MLIRIRGKIIFAININFRLKGVLKTQ